jgi:CubicO group peptidase (beta-lactamase class C family)
VSDEVCYPIASVTKTFTAWCCLQPQVRELLDVPFREVMPWFRVQNEEATRTLTPRDALCHFSGLAPQTASWVRSTQPRRAFLEHHLPGYDFAADFRSAHRYSNVMYAVLGQWLEDITGSAWENLIEDWIRKPLGLDSLQPLAPGWEQTCPPPHECKHGVLERIPPFFSTANHVIAPASELRMTMQDLARWGQHHLGLNPEDERWRPHSFVNDTRPFPEFGPLHYGLGWRLDTVHGRRRVWHTGQCSGYTTLLSLYPEEGTGLAAATNCSATTDALHRLDLRVLHPNQT